MNVVGNNGKCCPEQTFKNIFIPRGYKMLDAVINCHIIIIGRSFTGCVISEIMIFSGLQTTKLVKIEI